MLIIDVMQDSVDVLRAENGILQRKLEVKIFTYILIFDALLKMLSGSRSISFYICNCR
jgi:hypothetical protein